MKNLYAVFSYFMILMNSFEEIPLVFWTDMHAFVCVLKLFVFSVIVNNITTGLWLSVCDFFCQVISHHWIAICCSITEQGINVLYRCVYFVTLWGASVSLCVWLWRLYINVSLPHLEYCFRCYNEQLTMGRGKTN